MGMKHHHVLAFLFSLFGPFIFVFDFVWLWGKTVKVVILRINALSVCEARGTMTRVDHVREVRELES